MLAWLRSTTSIPFFRGDYFFFSSRRRHTRFDCDWSSDVCSSDLDHGHRIPAEGVADGARGAWVADAPRERRVRDDLAERDARGLRQHRGLELGHPVEVQGDPKERPAAREVFAELLARLLGVAAGAWGRRAEAPPRSEARHAVVARLNAESIGERFEPWRATPESPKQAGERVAWRGRGPEQHPEPQVER